MQTISELRAKAAELRRIADKVEAAADALAELGEPATNGTRVDHFLPVAHHGTGDLRNLSGIEAMENVLIEAERPLSKAEICDRLKERGKAIGSSTVESYLSRAKDRFKSFGRGYWSVPNKEITAESLFPDVRHRTRPEASK